jgi:hypothetical protein
MAETTPTTTILIRLFACALISVGVMILVFGVFSSLGSSTMYLASVWRRVSGIAPMWAWALAGVVQVAFVLAFWLAWSSAAPYHEAFGDILRGWPLVYGLDQGDVEGDEWGPFTTYFGLAEFALDTAAAVACGLPAIALVLWAGWRVRRNASRSPEPGVCK